MLVRSRAPLRLGIAGGGTDVSPYCDKYGGCVLNATINLFAHCTVEIGTHLSAVEFFAKDVNVVEKFNLDHFHSAICGETLLLHYAVYVRVVKDFNGGVPFPVRVVTYCDAPPGSGLGSSSTIVVSMLEAFRTALNLPLGEYDIARLAFDIERVDCGLSGGKQDQYSATFGGFNFMEFYADNRVVVNPLRIRSNIISELEASLILFFTGASRDSATIISDQMTSISEQSGVKLEAMHDVKRKSFKIKEYLLKGDLKSLYSEFQLSWEAKKRTSSSISNDLIDRVEAIAMAFGAKSLKVSGAGGGGFMMIFVDPEEKLVIEKALKEVEGQVFRIQFTVDGASSWII